MAEVPLETILGKSGDLTIGSQDFGSRPIIAITKKGTPVEHRNASDGKGSIDRVLFTELGMTMTTTVEEFAPDLFAMVFGGGTAANASFPFDENVNTYALEWTFNLESDHPDYSTVTVRHTSVMVYPESSLEMNQGEYAGVPVTIEFMFDEGGTYGDLGGMIFNA